MNADLEHHIAEFRVQLGLDAEVTLEGNRIFIVIKKAPLPPMVFRIKSSDILFMTDSQYPFSALDMFWTEVDVIRKDGGAPQGAELIENYIGRAWRRFSWHRNGLWNPASNGILDHYSFVESRWALEAGN